MMRKLFPNEDARVVGLCILVLAVLVLIGAT
jgi:hypothetical protein